MKKSICILWCMVFICAVTFTALWAQDKKPDGKDDALAAMSDKEKAEILQKLDLFSKVVSYGEDQKNPLILISAVELLDDIPFDAIIVTKPNQDEKKDTRYNRLSLLNQAKGYAAGDTELLALIEKVLDRSETVAVRSGGQKTRTSTSTSGRNMGTQRQPAVRYASSGHSRSGTATIPSTHPHSDGGPPRRSHGQASEYDKYEGGGHLHGCFIATAAYGSPFAERVEILRRFRDQRLLHTALGATFVDFYYQHSPAIANVISESPTARALTRTFLYPVTVIAGACLGQTADILQIILVFAVILASLAFVYHRNKHMVPRC